MSRLPTALVVGPMKAGTSWIQDYMESRGDVRVPDRVKETFFFEQYWQRGAIWYAGFFDDGNTQSTSHRLEIGSSYFHHPEVPRRVQETLGDIPILVTLRDPVRRAWSHYLHLRRYGHTRAPLQEAVKQYPEILEASRYRTCLRRWYAEFPEDCLHFVWQDTLKASPNAYAEAVCAALGLEARPVPETLKGPSNQAAVPASYRLAALGSTVTRSLRHIGLYRVVNGAKRMGLKRLFFGKPGSARGIEPTAEERAWLEAQLVGEIPPEAEAARHAFAT